MESIYEQVKWCRCLYGMQEFSILFHSYTCSYLGCFFSCYKNTSSSSLFFFVPPHVDERIPEQFTDTKHLQTEDIKKNLFATKHKKQPD